MKIYVLGNKDRAGVTEEVARWMPILKEKTELVTTDLCQECDLSLLAPADLVLVFGGDGAILRAARQMGYRQFPVLGVNLGRLGFLADVHPRDLCTCLDAILEGRFHTTQHLMYECVLEQQPGADREAKTVLGLNEVVVHSAPPLHMLDLELEVDGVTVARFSGDGLIISTPIGSTGHSLSAGGPILGQELAAFVITPICAHSLTYRPVVDSADKTYSIRLLSEGADHGIVIIDGQEAIPISTGQRVLIRKAPVSFHLVKTPSRGFFQTLRDKLHWGTPPNYRGEP